MQLTRFDHWLRECLLYERHIYTIRLPEGLPHRVSVSTLEREGAGMYRYLLVVSSKVAASKVVGLLRSGNQIFAVKIVEKDTLCCRALFAGKRSVFFRLFWILVFAASCLGLVQVGSAVSSSETLKGDLKEIKRMFWD